MYIGDKKLRQFFNVYTVTVLHWIMLPYILKIFILGENIYTYISEQEVMDGNIEKKSLLFDLAFEPHWWNLVEERPTS